MHPVSPLTTAFRRPFLKLYGLSVSHSALLHGLPPVSTELFDGSMCGSSIMRVRVLNHQGLRARSLAHQELKVGKHN